MPLPVIANVIRTAVEGLDSNAHKWANVMHFRKTGILTNTGAIAILDPILVDHYTNDHAPGAAWPSFARSDASVEQIRYTPLDGISASVINTHHIAGLSGGDALPASLSLVVTLRTANRGRSYRGRVYTGPYVESVNLSEGQPQPAAIAEVLAQWQHLLSALVGTGLSMVVASYHLVLATDVTAMNVDSRWDTQRRRLG